VARRSKEANPRPAGSGSAVLWRALLVVALVGVGLFTIGRLGSVPVRAPVPAEANGPTAPAVPPSTAPSPPPSSTPAAPEPLPPAPPPLSPPPGSEAGTTPPATGGTAPSSTLPTTELHWGYVPNSQHETPGIPAGIQTTLDRHAALWLGPTDKKVVYLTFDNGYEVGLTADILATLKRHQVKSIFFFTGANMKQNPDLVKKIVAEGYAVGNHTMTHLNLAEMGANKFETEVDGVDELYFGLTGRHLHYFRCPEGTYSEAVLARLQAKGYRTAFWSIAMRDWLPLPGGKEEALHGVIDHLHPGAVILLHSESKDDLAALDDIISQTQAMGYSFGDPNTL